MTDLSFRVRLLLTAAIVVVTVPATSFAGQQSDPRSAAGGTRLGPLNVDPTLSVSSGVDTNVFNEFDDPKRDYVILMNPQADVSMSLGRAAVTGSGSAPVHYYRKYSSQGTAGVRGQVRLAMPVNRLRPYIEQVLLTGKDRWGPEIDVRVPRAERITEIGSDVALSTKVVLNIAAQHAVTSYGDEAFFETVNLAEVLNRTGDGVSASFRYALTSLTRLVVTAEQLRERFEFQASRNSRTRRVLPAVEFETPAFVRGKASVGYREFDIADPQIDDFRGIVASVDLASTVRGTTLVAMSVRKDVAYSYDPVQPYYVVSALGGSVTQVITEHWRATVRAERQRLKYRQNSLLALREASPQIDDIYSYGGGLEYRIRQNLGVGIAIDASRRLSGVVRREYKATRVLSSLTYGS